MHQLIIMLIITTLTLQTQANQPDRYTLIDPTATPQQRFPLIEIKSITIPKSIEINGPAVDFILKGTGYAQAQAHNRSDADQTLMGKPLPVINHQFIDMTVYEMLQAIAGVGYVAVVDPIHRLVAFELDHAFN